MIKLIDILRISKQELKEILANNPNAIVGDNYILWIRDSKLPCLVAHIDTVYNKDNWHNRTIIHSQGYYWSPDGIGADDRAGVYAIMKLFNTIECNCIFTDGEESGGIGAREVVKEQRDILEKIPYFIEIDRRGNNQAVFYNNEQESNEEFYNRVNSLFDISQGSFSDISIIGRELLIASVNLSAGFYHEHMESGEYLYEPHLNNTINKIPKLIDILGKEQYKIKPVRDYWSYYTRESRWYYDKWYYNYDIVEMYEDLLQYSQHATIEDLIYEYGDIVSIAELKELRPYFSKKDYKKIEQLVKKIEKKREEVWKKYSISFLE